MAEYSRAFPNGKAEVDVIRIKWSDPWSVAHALELGGRPRGSRVVVLCPWHVEATPSCTIEATESGIHAHCYGCNRSGDVFDLAAAKLSKTTLGRDFAEVVDFLDRLPLPAGPLMQAPQARSKQVTSGNPLAFAVIAECFADLCPIARQQEVVDYLGQRCLLDEASQSGWVALPRGDDAQNRAIDKVIATVGEREWLTSGLARTDGGLLYPDHVLVIPWRDPFGYVTNLQRRLVDDTPNVPKYVNPTGRQFPWPYGIEHLLDADADNELMFVEGAFDALAVQAMLQEEPQHRLVLGVPGVSGWQREWRSLCVGRRVVLGFDADHAGALARDTVADDIRGVATEIRGSKPPAPYKDWADLHQNEGTA